MATIIKLRRVQTENDIYVNFDVVKFYSPFELGTRIFFNDNSDLNIIGVYETPEEILNKLKEL